MNRSILLITIISIIVVANGYEKRPVHLETNPVPTREISSETINANSIGKRVQTDDGMLTLELIEGYRIYLEEPNRYILTNNVTNESFARIEILDNVTNMGVLKSNLFESYRMVDEVSELAYDSFDFAFLDNSDFALKVVQNGTPKSTVEICGITNGQIKILASVFLSSDTIGIYEKSAYWHMISTIETATSND